ncbi:hypothetical protein BJ741DRAFT_633866 [Chytriomyces cf. hyalinus JEL632]|nr:hypothetical protein BJ741DRAFT_633866 [Chytriomyces cf. hyalinus JEL632]
MSEERTEHRRTILNETNYPVWRRLTLAEIGTVNARTLSPTFVPFVNRYTRPSPPRKWVNILEVSEEFKDLEDPNAEDTYGEEISETGSETETSEPPTISYSDFEKSEKIWLGFQKRATDDADAVRLTLRAIHGGMSKSMQIQYSLHDTPASLWEELRQDSTPQPTDTYRGLSIRENQTIPDYLKLVRYVEDACTAAGETLHLGLNAQKTVRLRLDHRFAQAVIVLTITVHENVLDLEKTMIDLWDGFKAALERNKPAVSKPTANVTIGNPDRKRKHDTNKGGKGKSNAYSGKNMKCDSCPGSHNPEYDCNACWRCARTAQKRLHSGSNNGGDDRSSVQSSSSNNSAVAATTTINAKPKHTGWVPASGLLNSN